MKRILLFVVMSVFAAGLAAQSNLQKLLTTYTESVRLPFYKECKRYDDRVPKSIDNVTINGATLTVVYVVNNLDADVVDLGKYNTYTVSVDLSKALISKSTTTIIFSDEDGIEITEENGATGKKHPFLVKKWIISCNDSPLCNKLFAALGNLGTLEVEGNADGNAVDNARVDGMYAVSGRMLKGKLVEPEYSGNATGMVVIAIRVNAAGKVVDAIKGSGTTIASANVVEACITAAKRCTFTEGNSMVAGTISYRFK